MLISSIISTRSFFHLAKNWFLNINPKSSAFLGTPQPAKDCSVCPSTPSADKPAR